MASYTVMIDDNFHYMDPDERLTDKTYQTCEEAIARCKQITDESLENCMEIGMTADKLIAQYVTFGDDPWISCEDKSCQFSARKYAIEKSKEIAASVEKKGV